MAMWLAHSEAGAGSLMISGESLHGAHTERPRKGSFHQWTWRHTHLGRSKGRQTLCVRLPTLVADLPSSVNPQQKSSEGGNPVKSAVRIDHHKMPGVILPVQQLHQ